MTTDHIERLRAEIHELVGKLRTERDELHVRLHLAGAEARAEWEQIEPKWHHLQGKAQQVAASAGEASKDVGAAAKLLGEEIANAYRRIRKSIES